MMRTLTTLVLTLSIAAAAFAADRMTDRDVKALVARIEEDRDRFDNELDREIKTMVIRSETRELKVAQFLDDFQAAIDRLEERLKPDYAGSTEAAALLRSGTTLHTFLQGRPVGTKGVSEWNRVAVDLKSLARAYGADFPLSDNATVRRIGDRELSAGMNEVVEQADRLKGALSDDLKKDPTVASATRATTIADADEFGKAAKVARDRIKDGQPSTAEVDRVFVHAARLATFIEGHAAPSAARLWAPIASSLQTIAGAYGTDWRGPR